MVDNPCETTIVGPSIGGQLDVPILGNTPGVPLLEPLISGTRIGETLRGNTLEDNTWGTIMGEHRGPPLGYPVGEPTWVSPMWDPLGDPHLGTVIWILQLAVSFLCDPTSGKSLGLSRRNTVGGHTWGTHVKLSGRSSLVHHSWGTPHGGPHIWASLVDPPWGLTTVTTLRRPHSRIHFRDTHRETTSATPLGEAILQRHFEEHFG